MRFTVFLTFVILTLAACSSSTNNDQNLPPGDATRGAELFTQSIGGAPACSTCHTLDGSTLVGPSLQGFSAVAGTRIQGVSAEDYIHNSIVRPAEFLVSGFGNTMYNQFQQKLTPQQLADLIAYLLTL